MFEITGNEISQLSDSDLRSLIGLLCEAELRINNLPTAGVTFGGHQDAKDGGLDVRVDVSVSLNPDGFIPRSSTGYQVRKYDMPRSKIIKEMCPDGQLRPVITELANSSGAYIIVSGAGSTSYTALKHRRNAMLESTSGIGNANNLKLDFYDQERIAAWVRCYPSLVLWVRQKIRKPMIGWRPYENWANAPGGIEEEYLLDDKIRLYNEANPNSNRMTAINGINELRSILKKPASSVRLIGLSGVGKTRLLQALFDERIADNPLNPSLVFYSDVSNCPNPDPRNFAEHLIALKRPAILAVDNCPPNLHRCLTSVCSVSGSLVSLITVEYDVREDQPEETDVFRLEPATTELIEKLIRNRFDYIGQVDARTVAEFSGGNARIAIALAKNIHRGETITNLQDEELLRRLFIQGNESNSDLMRSAEVCSLVYSFDSQTTSGQDSELVLLGSLIGRSVGELYNDIAELKRRDLVQRRNIWGAVLPHAIANRLASRALENIPQDNLINVFVSGGSKRLLKSFSRRLGYLHQSDVAKKIAEDWLSEKGLLGNVSNLNNLGITLLENIAPVKPLITLEAIERAANGKDEREFTSRSNTHFREFTWLLRSLAYDPALFERCIQLICRFALSEGSHENHDSIRDLIKSLFYIRLSGTHATVDQRLGVINQLLNSKSDNEKELGLMLTSAALEATHFSPPYSFDFGARPRDFGYLPNTRKEIHQWFAKFISLTESLAVSDQPIAVKAKILLAKKIRGLWRAGMFDELERAAKSIIKIRPWNEGWIAVRSTIRFDADKMGAELSSRLQGLEELLKPNTLIEKARTYALSDHGHAFDLADIEDETNEKVSRPFDRAATITRQIGKEVASDEEILNLLLPEFLASDGIRLYSFGQGLAKGCTEPLKIWKKFCNHLSSIDANHRNYGIMLGFLNTLSEINYKLCEQILDDAVTNDMLSVRFPALQTSVEIDSRGVERLKQSLELGLAPIWTYRNLAIGKAHESISDEDLSELLRIIASKPDGLVIAVDILHVRFYGKSIKYSSSLTSIGQELLARIVFSRENDRRDRMDYELSRIAEVCLIGTGAVPKAKKLCDKLVNALLDYQINFWDYTHLFESIARKQPRVFLDSFLNNCGVSNYHIRRLFADDFELSTNPLPQIADEVIIDWCGSNPSTRYPAAATAITAFRQINKENQLEWTPLALTLINKAPNPVAVLNELKRIFRPMSCSGSRADIMQKRLGLLARLKSHKNKVISEWANKEERLVEEEIRLERQQEERNNVSLYQAFE